MQTAVTASRGEQRGDVQIRKFLHHNGAPRDFVFDLTLTYERWEDTDDPSKMGKLRAKTVKYLADYANNRYISFLPAVFSTWGRLDAESLRLTLSVVLPRAPRE